MSKFKFDSFLDILLAVSSALSKIVSRKSCIYLNEIRLWLCYSIYVNKYSFIQTTILVTLGYLLCIDEFSITDLSSNQHKVIHKLLPKYTSTSSSSCLSTILIGVRETRFLFPFFPGRRHSIIYSFFFHHSPLSIYPYCLWPSSSSPPINGSLNTLVSKHSFTGPLVGENEHKIPLYKGLRHSLVYSNLGLLNYSSPRNT